MKKKVLLILLTTAMTIGGVAGCSNGNTSAN